MNHSASVASSTFFGSGKRPWTFVICLLMTDGQRVANTTLIDTLLDKDFQLLINNEVYDVKSPEKGKRRLVVLLSDPSLQIASSFVLLSLHHSVRLQRTCSGTWGRKKHCAFVAHGHPPARTPPAEGETAAGETGQPQTAALAYGEGKPSCLSICTDV